MKMFCFPLSHDFLPFGPSLLGQLGLANGCPFILSLLMHLRVPCRLSKVWISTVNSVRLMLIQHLKMPKRKQCDTDNEPILEKKQLQQYQKEYPDQRIFIIFIIHFQIFIIKGKNEEGSAFCTVCNFEFTIKYSGLNDIT